MALYDSSWQYFTYTRRSIGVYIIFYHGGTIAYGTHVPGPVPQSGVEIEYNTVCTAEMDLECFRMLITEFLNKDPYIVPEKAPLITLDSKSSVCMANIGKGTKHTGHI